jgi:hypothetical protein
MPISAISAPTNPSWELSLIPTRKPSTSSEVSVTTSAKIGNSQPRRTQ